MVVLLIIIVIVVSLLLHVAMFFLVEGLPCGFEKMRGLEAPLPWMDSASGRFVPNFGVATIAKALEKTVQSNILCYLQSISVGDVGIENVWLWIRRPTASTDAS